MPIYCGVDFHSRQQTIAWCDTRDGEIHFDKLAHQLDDVRAFYARFEGEVIVGLEASGYSNWFEDLLSELHHQVRVGNPAEVRARARARQKTDRRDAELLLDLLLKDEFPQIHRPSAASREALRLLRYRQRLVQLRTKTCNNLHAIALSAGVSLKAKLLTKAGRRRLNELTLSTEHRRQREEWLELIDQLQTRIQRADQELARLAADDDRVTRLQTHPGIGVQTALALVHTLEPLRRFANSRKVAAYVGLEPREYSSGDRQRFGRISKAGPRLLRYLLIEAAHHAVRHDPDLKRLYWQLLQKKNKGKAIVAVARRLLIRAYILWRDEIDYAEFLRRGVEVQSARKSK
ncbi:MAG TPA: IS110 family transposase [Blastocatellia bacterium]|nr:IS110 family transposase [Blastocatellia bacterium]